MVPYFQGNWYNFYAMGGLFQQIQKNHVTCSTVLQSFTKIYHLNLPNKTVCELPVV